MNDPVGANDGDTTYIENKNTNTSLYSAPVVLGYDHAFIPPAGTISNVTVKVVAKKFGTSTNNSRNITGVLRIKGPMVDVDYPSTNSNITKNYVEYSFGFNTNPSGGAWDWSQLTGSATGSLSGFGVKASTVPTSTNYYRVTSIYLVVTITNPKGTYQIIIDQGSTPAAGVLDAMASDVRFGLTYYNTDDEGGVIDKYIGYNQVPNIVQSISDKDPSGYTPLSETLFEVTRYMQQDNPYYAHTPADFVPNLTNDPFYYAGTINMYVPCTNSYVIFLTDGESTMDQNMPGITGTSACSPPYTATGGGSFHIKGCSGSGGLKDVTNQIRYAGTKIGSTYASSGTDYLIDVAYWARSQDLRPGTETDVPTVWRRSLPGTQEVYLYPVFLFGSGSTLLKDAAIYGGFNDLNKNGKPDCITAPAECYRDSNNDGVVKSDGSDDPITYFEGDDGYKLEASITAALNDILRRSASGTAASVLASGEGSGANLLQSIFYPKALNKLPA